MIITMGYLYVEGGSKTSPPGGIFFEKKAEEVRKRGLKAFLIFAKGRKKIKAKPYWEALVGVFWEKSPDNPALGLKPDEENRARKICLQNHWGFSYRKA